MGGGGRGRGPAMGRAMRGRGGRWELMNRYCLLV